MPQRDFFIVRIRIYRIKGWKKLEEMEMRMVNDERTRWGLISITPFGMPGKCKTE
jgi:hypothetical protein